MASILPVKLLCTAYQRDQLLPWKGPMALFLGRSNAGKSTLLNALMQKELAKTSKQPGKTQSINYFEWGHQFLLVDVPGYGYARIGGQKQGQWEPLLRDFFDTLPAETAAFLLIDALREVEQEEIDLCAALGAKVTHLEILRTKSDRFNQSERAKCKAAMENMNTGLAFPLTWRFVSAKKGEGMAELRRWLFNYAKKVSH